MICHDPDAWLAQVDGRVHDRLHGCELGLDRYGVDELADILEQRADVGLPDSIVTRGQLEDLADAVAGVARHALFALREAARAADQRGHDQITDQDIADAPDLAQFRIRTQTLHSLPLHHQILYALVQEHGELSGDELHDHYDRVAEDIYDGRPLTPVSRRDRRRKLEKLEAYDLVESNDRDDRGRVYRVCDEEIGPPVAIRIPA